MDYFTLANTDQNTLDKIKIAEKEKRYNEHLDPITADGVLPVKEDFPYIPGPFRAFGYWCCRTFYLNWFIKKLNKKVFNTKVNGKENLKGIKGAVYICNHINKFDALTVNYALGHRKLKIMVAEFNNRPGFLGTMMRADGILPFVNSRALLIKFTKAINYYLNNNTGVLFFPEGSEWWCYKKPRPFMDGAFHFAAGNNVPVVPIFITFTDKADKKSELDVPDFTVNILKPVYPKEDFSKSENTKYLKEEAYKACCEKYEDFYKTKLEF